MVMFSNALWLSLQKLSDILYKTEQKYLHIWESENSSILTFLTMNQSSKKLVSIFLVTDWSVSPLMNAALPVLGGGGFRHIIQCSTISNQFHIIPINVSCPHIFRDKEICLKKSEGMHVLYDAGSGYWRYKVTHLMLSTSLICIKQCSPLRTSDTCFS